jgi:hypothetical protein
MTRIGMNDTRTYAAGAPTLDYASPRWSRRVGPWDVVWYCAWAALMAVLWFALLGGLIALFAPMPRDWSGLW